MTGNYYIDLYVKEDLKILKLEHGGAAHCVKGAMVMDDSAVGRIQHDILQGLLGGIGDGVILTDRKERVTYLNTAAARILNCSPQMEGDVYFSDVCPLVNLKTGKPFENPLRRALREDTSVGLARNVGVMLQGGPAYLSATCSPMRDASGNVIGWSVILREITQLRRLEMKIESDHSYMRSIFAAAKIGLCVVDGTGAIVDINEAGLELMQISYHDAIHLQFGDAFRCENSLQKGCGHGMECRHCPVRKNLEVAILDDDFTSEFTVALSSMDTGEPVWLKVFISQAWSESGKQIIIALVDVSRRKRREKALELARQKAEAASRAKGQFLANMSHEIRTPINGMNGMIDLTLRTQLDKEQRENLLSAKRCSEDLLHIINDILDFSKLESGRMKLEDIHFDLWELLRQESRVHGRVAMSKGIWFLHPFHHGLPRFVHGDPLRLRQILNNLLTNALKFTAEGTIAVTAAEGQRRGRPSLEFGVHDTGIGMDWKGRRKLFKAFSQVDGSTTRQFGGTGLGLMIVKQLVEAMGGEIKVFSIPGRGSSFCFWIPLVKAEHTETAPQRKSIFLQPRDEHQAPEKKRRLEEDVSSLLAYCESRLRGESNEDFDR